MACKSENIFPKTPPNFRNEYSHSKKGHLFYEDRPNYAKKLRFSRSKLTKTCCQKKKKKLTQTSSLSLMQVPVIRCPCGKGPCTIFTSHSEKNPNRMYYTCYQRESLRKCRFFRWVDEVLEFKVPQCPCGAGACSLNRDENGRWFLACRIKKGHGACGFFQWADLRTNSGMNMHFHDNIKCASPHCSKTSPQDISTLHFEDDEEASWEIVVQELESSNHEVLSTSSSMEDEINNRYSYSIIQATKSSNRQVLGTLPSQEAEVPNMMSETKSLDDSNLKKICCGSFMVSQSENDRKSVSCKQICAEGDILNQDGIRQHIGLQVCDWLDRLAFPLQCREDQPVLPFCCYDATLPGVEGSAIGTNGVENSKVIIQQPPTPSKDAQLSRGVSRCHPRCQNRNTRQNDSTSLSVFKHIGQGLLRTLEDKDLVDREEMCKIAESVFEAFRHLSISHSSFSKHVMKYIDYKSRLGAVEDSMREGLSFQELEGIFKRKEAECEAAESNFQSLHGESSYAAKKRKLFRNLEQELEQSENKTSELKTNFFKISPEISAKESERKFLQDETTTALEMAKAELPS